MYTYSVLSSIVSYVVLWLVINLASEVNFLGTCQVRQLIGAWNINTRPVINTSFLSGSDAFLLLLCRFYLHVDGFIIFLYIKTDLCPPLIFAETVFRLLYVS